jgi:hypothetical protein
MTESGHLWKNVCIFIKLPLTVSEDLSSCDYTSFPQIFRKRHPPDAEGRIHDAALQRYKRARKKMIHDHN